VANPQLRAINVKQMVLTIRLSKLDLFMQSELGTFSPIAVSVRLGYIKRVLGIKNHLEEEQHLLDLLVQFGGIPRFSTPWMILNLAHNMNRQGRHDEAEEMALEVLSLLKNMRYTLGE